MMISPKGFVEELKGKNYKQLIEERNELMAYITEYEKKELAGDRSGDEWNYCPSPEVKYQCNLEYLSELCNYMQQKYNEEYVHGDKTLETEI